MSEATPAPAQSPAEALEQMILLSHRFTAMLEDSPLLRTRGLSLEGFALLAAAAERPGENAGRLARLSATPIGPSQVLRDLAAGGFVTVEPIEGGKGRGVTPTDKGLAALAEIRAEFARIAGGIEPEKSWLAVPRYGRLMRLLRPEVEAKPAPRPRTAA